MNRCRIKIIIALSYFCAFGLTAQEHVLPSPSSSFARSSAMGGAFTAVEDGFENILFNPAAMNSSGLSDKNLYMSFNPAGAGIAAARVNSLTDRTERQPHFWLSLGGVFLKNISFSNPTFQLSFLLSEDLRTLPLANNDHSNLNTDGLLDNHYHAAAFRISLAKQVSIGASAFYFNQYQDGEMLSPKFGSSYGIFMRPSDKLQAGISYFYFPDHVDDAMLELYDLRKKTINAGICYSPIYQLKFAFDVRNVSGDEASTPDQIHAGIEVLPSYRIALRSGYSSGVDDKRYLSFGFGVGDFRPFRTESDFVFSNILINYALRSDIQDFEYLMHSLTFLIRI